VDLSSNRFNNVVQGQSLVMRVHHSKKSGSVKRSKWSVFGEHSPYIEGSVFTGVVIVGKDSLNWNVDGGNSNVRSIGFQPFNTKVVNGVFARILLELDLEVEAIRRILKSGGHIISQESSGGSISAVKCGTNYSVAWENSVFNSGRGEWGKSKSEGRDGIEGHLKNSRYSVVDVFIVASSLGKGVKHSKLSLLLTSTTSELSLRHDQSREDSFVVRGKDGGGVEHEIVVVVVGESWQHFGAWHVV